MLGQAILPKMQNSQDFPIRVMIFACRFLNYSCTMCRLVYTHSKEIAIAYKVKETSRWCYMSLPSYLWDLTDCGSFILMVFLSLMCTHEPMYWCAFDDLQ